MNILLVNPPSQRKVRPGESNLYPFSLLFLSSYLYKNGYRAKILDLSPCEDPRLELTNYLKDKSIDIIGFTSNTESRFIVWDLISDPKKVLTNTKIVVGGKHFTYTAQETLEVIPEIDVIVRGEGEITFLELVKSYESKGNLSDILGISYRENGEIVHNPDRPFEKNIDKFVIDEKVFNDVISLHGNYSPFVTLRNYKKENIKALTIHIGRGCPGKCVYCLNHKEQYRTRSVDSIIKEIKRKMKEYDCRVFHLSDPHLIKRTGFVKEFCNRIIDEKIGIKWWAETRADINLELIDLMSKAGCVSLDFGLESASDRVQASIKKAINVRQVEQLIKKCAHVGIRIKVFTMISLPDEREEDALKTLKFLKSFKPYLQHFTAALTKIYPGSDLEVMAKERGILKEDFSWYDKNYQNDLPQFATSCVPIWMEHLSPEFIIDYKEQIRFIRFSRFKAIAKKIFSYIFEYSFKRKWNGIRPFYSLLRHKSKIMQMRKTVE